MYRFPAFIRVLLLGRPLFDCKEEKQRACQDRGVGGAGPLRARETRWTCAGAGASRVLGRCVSKALNTACCFSTTRTRGRASHIALALVICVIGFAPAAHAQTPIDPMKSMAAWRAVDLWVRDWSYPQAAQYVDPPNAAGACVTLRLGGQVVGRGQDLSEDGAAVWRATGQAMARARARMPIERDALRGEAIIDYAARLTIDVQVIEDLLPMPEEGLTSLASRCSPGLDGVAARIGDRIEAVFPGTMLATNLSPGQALVSALSAFDLPSLGVGDPRQSLRKLREEYGLVIYRFRCHHVAQIEAGAQPRFLFRGGRVRLKSEVSAKSLRQTGARIRRHLLSRRFPGQASMGLMADYQPWSDEYADPVVAGPRSQGLAALALARWGSSQGDDDATQLGASILRNLQIVEKGEEDPTDDAVASAFIAMAVIALEDEAHSRELNEFAFRYCAARVRSAFDANTGFDSSLTSAERAVVSAALAEMARGSVGGILKGTASEAVRRVFREAPANQIAAHMPWIGWAEVALVNSNEEIPSAVALRSFRRLVWEHQLSSADAADLEPDLVGGVVFTASRTPLPSWQTFRPVAFIATMLGDARLTTGDERAPEAARLIASLRFLMQLQVGPDGMHMFRSEERAGGGIRLAPWDQTLTLEASALGLLTLSEALESMAPRAADAD